MALPTLPKMFPVHILKNKPGNFLLLTPVFAIGLFITLYIVAALLYPGGSQVDVHSKGFSWINNYWCNLLNEKAINGKINPARPVALAGMMVLCFALSFFWYVLPKYVRFYKYTGLAIQFSGVLAMLAAVFMFTSFHDSAINIAGFFGVIALFGTFKGLYTSKWYRLFCFGIFNLLLVVTNNYVYHTKELIIYLPVIQKISFASFLGWICMVDVKLYFTGKIARSEAAAVP